MKKITLLFIILLGFSFQSLKAQETTFMDRLVPHTGFMMEYVNYRIVDTTGNEYPSTILGLFYTLNLGTYITLAHTNDVASVGVDPNINVGLNFRQDGIAFQAQAPVFLMGRVGAASTKYNEQRIGAGAGVGGIYTYISEPGQTGFKKGFFNPAAVFEGSLFNRGSVMTARLHVDIVRLTTSYNNQDYKFGTLGGGLLYTF